jgi:pimeloyl-ACP methyl ester carboxylesterase
MEHQLKESGKYKYIDRGEGEPIVILHGLFGALSNFDGVLDHFSKTHRVIIPMLPIYDLPVLKTNVKKLADFLRDFVKHMKFDKVNLLGNSLGGHIALVFTKNFPDRVNSMILTGSSGLYENAFGASFPRREDKEFIRKKVSVTFYDPALATDELVDECYEVVNDRNRLIRILAIAKSAIRHNMAQDLPEMTMPVCLIWGKDDTITPPDVAREFDNKLPDSDLYWIDKCGHAPMMERPEEFNKLMDAWLKERKI